RHVDAVDPLVEELQWVGVAYGSVEPTPGVHASASAGRSWMDGIGDGKSHARPRSAPMVAIHRVGRTPISVPSPPPSAVPTGRTPLFTTMNAPDTRERSGGGTMPALIVPAMMSSSISPTPEISSAAKRHVTTTQCGPPAAGTRMSGAGKRKQPSTNVGPMPKRREMRPATNDPPGVPTAPTPTPSPHTAHLPHPHPPAPH